jgi:hypothetical protein
MRIVQFLSENGNRHVALVRNDEESLQLINGATYLRDLAMDAAARGSSLEEFINERLSNEVLAYLPILDSNRILLPLDHPDPAHAIVSGTGLDHLGSAQARDAMHQKLHGNTDELTDSMRMFKWGLEGGKPAPGEIGSQPEWFYKGDGSWVVPPGHPLPLPAYALDGGEEPELVGLYVIGAQGQVLRVGFAIGNEYSDHVLEKQNYLYLAHSKLRASSFGPEVLIGAPPHYIEGTVRILRDDTVLWSASFLTGEANMTHTITNIEHHHFKYAAFRRPGDVHFHYYGTATLSFAAGIKTQPGDIFEIQAPGFGKPLRNPIIQDPEPNSLVQVNVL